MKRSLTFQINLDLRAVALLSAALLLIGLIIAATTAEAVPRGDDPVPQATPGLDADKVDGHHAGPSDGTKSQRANRVLWAQSNGTFSTKALPMAQLDNLYLNDDQNETINGNLQQPPNYNGLVKAAVYVDKYGHCGKDFNPYATTTCSYITTGQYTVDFNFKIDDRVVVVTAVDGSHALANFLYQGDQEMIRVFTFDSSDGTAENNCFTVVVF